ncbi:TolC family protein [Winogradskyella flava]|uniref:TolC family protein n=1 Tax=Winogradskyella flava TaxID=1884876 RepID=UPI0024907FC0|nr:TolC family protein [Winogradskyella flava]
MERIKKCILFLLLVGLVISIQAQNNVTIGILSDESTPQTKPLLEQLKDQITAVIGQNTTIAFKDVLVNNYDTALAKSNYQQLINGDADIILSFGVINNIVLYTESSYPKPTIVFGSVNNDFIDLPEDQTTSGINNVTYIIAPISYKDDLEIFSSIFDFKKVGIIVDDYLLETLPVKDLFDTYFSNIESSYKLIPISKDDNISNELGDIDAVYLAGGFYESDSELKSLIDAINSKKLPSFSAFENRTVQQGILATNQPETSISQFFRRVALNIESIINGTNASELPLLIDYKKKLSINYGTAKQIEFPLRYSLLAKADFVGDDTIVDSEISLSLIEIMNDVVDNNLSLQSERKTIELASQDVKASKSTFLPDVTASASGIYIDPRVAEIAGGASPEFSTSGAVVANQLIYSESAAANIDIQKNLQKAQVETYNSVELDALLNASVAYFNALILKTNTKIQNENLKVTKRNLELAEQNFEAGASGKSDVLRFRSQLAQNTQSLIEAGNQLSQSFFTINQLLNTKISNKINVLDAELSEGVFQNYRYQDFFELLDNPKLQSSLIEFLIIEAKKNAPELKNLDYNLKVIERNYDLNDYGRFIPTVSLQGQYSLAISQSGAGSTIPIGIPSAPDGTYNVGLNVALPIFQQNQRNINRQTATIQADQLQIQKANTDLNIEKNVNDIVLDLVNQIANIEISKIAEETAKESLELTQNAYKEGAVPVIQLIDAQTNYLQTQLARATANYNYLITSMQLERAIGYFFLMHTEAENQEFIQRAQQYILSQN